MRVERLLNDGVDTLQAVLGRPPHGAAEVEDAVELIDSKLSDIRDLEGGMDDV